jgi:hypothetical protein
MFKKKSALLFCLWSLISAISYSAYSGESAVNMEQDKLPPEMGMCAFNDLGRKELCTLRLTSSSWKEMADTLIHDKGLLNIVFTPKTVEERDLEALKSIGPLAGSISILGYDGSGDDVTKLIQVFDEISFGRCSKVLLIGNTDFGLCENEYNLYKILKRIPTLKELVLMANQFNILSILQAASRDCLKQLHSLHILVSDMDDSQLFLLASCAISGCFPKLATLDLRGGSITFDGLNYLSVIPQNCLPELTDIDISMNKQLDTSNNLNAQQGRLVIETILKNNPKVTTFNMMHCDMNKYYLKSLSKSFPSVYFSFPNIAYIGGLMKPEQLLVFGFEVVQSLFEGFSHGGDDSDSEDSDSDDGPCVIQ